MLEDAVLSFRKLKKNGMIFDDYGWAGFNAARDRRRVPQKIVKWETNPSVHSKNIMPPSLFLFAGTAKYWIIAPPSVSKAQVFTAFVEFIQGYYSVA